METATFSVVKVCVWSSSLKGTLLMTVTFIVKFNVKGSFFFLHLFHIIYITVIVLNKNETLNPPFFLIKVNGQACVTINNSPLLEQ